MAEVRRVRGSFVCDRGTDDTVCGGYVCLGIALDTCVSLLCEASLKPFPALGMSKDGQIMYALNVFTDYMAWLVGA